MSFKISVPASGHEFIAEVGESILEAAIRQGVGLPYGCRNGACGSCTVNLLQGKVVYPSQPHMTVDTDQVLLCSAVPAAVEGKPGKIVLQL